MSSPDGSADVRHLDDNLDERADRTVVCRHCGFTIGDRTDVLAHARRRESPPRLAGPAVRADATVFTDRPIVLRQAFCPGCLVQLQAEIVPADEPHMRHRTLAH